MLYGRKLDPSSRMSTIGGSKVDEVRTGMEYGPGVSSEPFIRADPRPRHVGPVGVISPLTLTGEVGLAEFERARAMARERHASPVPASREPTIDERLRRLGIHPRSTR